MEDTYIFENTSNIVEVWENEFWKYIILDETIFYPQWWWQPSDVWEIKSEERIFCVEMVRFDENKEKIYHYGNFSEWNIREWEKVFCSIDKEKRIINAKNHSAWHLLSMAIGNIWLKQIIPQKGFHFPRWSYVECDWILEEEKEKVLEKLNIELQKLISKNINLKVNNDNPLSRRVIFEGYEESGCWGTHVKNTSEIWSILVTKIKTRKWKTKFSYKVL